MSEKIRQRIRVTDEIGVEDGQRSERRPAMGRRRRRVEVVAC
jgi:hypothetical protein